MDRIHHVRLMAAYNTSMNASIYAAARRLPAAELGADRKAFFGSLLGTLNHLVNADLIWLKRFAGHATHFAQLEAVRALPDPAALGALSFGDLDSLWERRRWLDAQIAAWTGALGEADLDQSVRYVNARGAADKNLFSLLMHFFNHQTHHRGQASTLLFQQGIDIGVTDLLALVADNS